ncbi:HmuY family protein [Sphingobacterium chuzhouense]|uniref:HmuY family protein n=1 Tax=Sphingobacterium chuzhouense TaxID=1742264 RepID=A0ABR7XP81_9SPHI|nr:HmuY family protein [Sphingobacterium chuzhouense]MBD1420985.1 HmuY family protein [Sphingobacterium chuzhouense]
MIKHHIFQKTGLFALILGLIFTSCSKKNDPAPDDGDNVLEMVAIKDLNGLDKGHVCFSLEQKKEVEESSKDWDIKFSGATISFGNGASGQMVEGILSSYMTAPEDGYSASGITGNGSYYTNTTSQTVPNHAILMKPGILIVVKTAKGRYAKIEMIGYYKGNPDIATADFADIPTRNEKWPKQHYTFNYVLQPNGTNKF